MPLKADPFSTKLHRRIDAVLFLVTIGIIALVVRVSAHGQSAPSRARGPVDLFSAPLALFQTGSLAGGNYLALWQAPFWAVQPDYPNGSASFSVLAGLSGKSEFDTTFLISEEISASVTPVTLELGHARRSFTPSVSTLVNWSNRAGVGSTIPAYGTGFGAGSTLPQSDVAIAVASSIKAGTSQSGAAQIIDSATALNLSAAPLGDTARMNPAGAIRSFTMDPPTPAPDEILATFTWDGGGANDDWSTAGNWTGAGVPALTGDDIEFGGGTRLAPNMEASYNINSLTFNSGAGAFVLTNTGGTTLTIQGGGITNNDDSLQTINISDITLGAAQTWSAASGALTVSSAVDNGGNLLTVNAASATILSGAIGGAGGLTKEGAGRLTLTGPNTYSGDTNINAGVLTIGHSNALGAANSTTVASGAALELTNYIAVGNEALTLNGTGVGNGGALRNISGVNSWAGTITINSTTRITSDLDVLILDVASGSAITGSNHALQFGGAGDVYVDDAIATGSGTVTKDGAGTLILAGANSFTGALTISAGTLQINTINNASTVGVLGNSANAVTLGSGGFTGTLQYTGGNASSTKNFTVGTGGTGAFQIDNAATTLTLSGTIDGGGFLSKTGAGTLILNQTNTYTGATAVNAGTLLIDGDQSGATGAVSVNNLGTLLGGIGTIGGAVTVNADANITGATNGTVGTLTMASLSFTGTAMYIVDILGAASDTLNITGVLDLSGLFDALSVMGTLDGTTSYLLATFGSIMGTFDDTTDVSVFGYHYVYTANELRLSPLTPVPEPSTWVAGILTVLALGWTQRRRLGKFALRRADGKPSVA